MPYFDAELEMLTKLHRIPARIYLEVLLSLADPAQSQCLTLQEVFLYVFFS